MQPWSQESICILSLIIYMKNRKLKTIHFCNTNTYQLHIKKYIFEMVLIHYLLLLFHRCVVFYEITLFSRSKTRVQVPTLHSYSLQFLVHQLPGTLNSSTPIT